MTRSIVRLLGSSALALSLLALPSTAMAGIRERKSENGINGECKPVPELSLLAAGSAAALLAGGALSAFGARRRKQQ
ncbi:MAG: hypothetical protein AB7N76_19900 [Planctomycetota bacterium]